MEILKYHFSWVYFKNIENQWQLPFVIHADFKSILRSYTACENSGSGTTYENSREKLSTRKTQTHITCGACVCVKCSDNRFFCRPLVIQGENVTE